MTIVLGLDKRSLLAMSLDERLAYAVSFLLGGSEEFVQPSRVAAALDDAYLRRRAESILVDAGCAPELGAAPQSPAN
jgi:hypothetical protein